VQIAMEQAMQAAVGTGRANYSRGRDPEAERKARVDARADVEFDKLPEPWDRCVGLLETVKNAKKDDPNAPCVICSRKGADGKYGFGPNGFPHPTRKRLSLDTHAEGLGVVAAATRVEVGSSAIR